MAGYTLSPIKVTVLSCKCECFQTFFSKPQTEKKKLRLKGYIDYQIEKCEFLSNEVHKHQFFNIEEFKPCLGATTTYAYILKTSYFRHLRTLKQLKSTAKKVQRCLYIKFESGGEVSVDCYINSLKQLIEGKNFAAENLLQNYSEVSVLKLIESEEQHLETLKIFQNVLEATKPGDSELEVVIKSPI